jgi:hypothetical protein
LRDRGRDWRRARRRRGGEIKAEEENRRTFEDNVGWRECTNLGIGISRVL